jgi:general nucleoside transport system ATP-binding protein
MMSPILSARNIDKSFGFVTALRDASVALQTGHVTAIVGENGAGKSTLAKILAGILRPDRGEILLDGATATFRRRADAIAAGIGFVPQSLSFITTLTLVENHALSRRGIIVDRREATRELAAAAEELGVDIPFDVPLEGLSLPQRQIAEIVSAVASGARVLLLDEPTSALGPLEIERLIAAIRRLADRGTAIGLVTHRITEVLAGADTVAVLRGGVKLFEGKTAGLDPDAIARLMVGVAAPAKAKLSEPTDQVRIRAENLSVAVDGTRYLDEIVIEVRGGEIVGIAGVAGASQTMLAEVLAGLRKPTTGRVLIDGIDITGNARAASRLGLAHIPDDRATAIVPHLSVAENASLFRVGDSGFSRFGMRRKSAEINYALEVADRTDVRPRQPALSAAALSGGNQQKLLVGRELSGHPIAIVAHGPTQGLDIAASAESRRQLVESAASGSAVVLISADLDEILSVSHRLVILSGGRISDNVDLRRHPPDMVRLGRAIGATVAQSAPAVAAIKGGTTPGPWHPP